MRKTLRRPLVTVGVTSFNSAATIRRCLQSVAEQSLGASRIEVLIADDGSTDDTLARARRFRTAAPWARFKLMRHRNTGNASTGRNRILKAATGKYLFYLDSDDYLGPEALTATTASARRHRCDVVVGKYVGVDRSAPNVLGAEELPEVHEYHSGWLNSLHIQKLFRTAFLRSLDYRFNPKLHYANDHPFMLNAFLHAKRVSFVSSVDCYFITLTQDDSDGPGHVSRASLSAAEQLRFLHDCFGLLALARGQGGSLGQLAGRMRADYWNRLLKLHLPMLLIRKTDDDAAAELGAAAANLTEIYGAQTSRSRLAPAAQQMLNTLRSTDGPELMQTAHAVRRSEAREPADTGADHDRTNTETAH